MATDILESSMQDSLDMIVGDDGKLSNVAVCRELDLKIPNVMKKPNPVEYIFKGCVRYFHQIFIFPRNDSSSKTMKNAFYFI